MKQIIDYDFEAEIVENKTTGQKTLTIPLPVRDKYITGRKYKVILILKGQDDEVSSGSENHPPFPMEPKIPESVVSP